MFIIQTNGKVKTMKKSSKIIFSSALAALMIAGTTASAVAIYYAISKSKTNKTTKLNQALTDTSTITKPLAASNFLPSEYIIPQLNSYNPTFFKAMGINAYGFQQESLTKNITSVSLVNCDDENGTADLRVTYRGKFQDTYIPLVGFLKKADALTDLEMTINQDFKRAIPSYFYSSPEILNQLKDSIQCIDQPLNHGELKLSIPYANDDNSVFVLRVEYRGKVKAFTLKTDYNTETMLNAIVAKTKYDMNSRATLSASEFINKYNTIDELFNPIDDKTQKPLLYNADLLRLNHYYSDDEALLVYKVAYNDKSVQHSISNLYTDEQKQGIQFFQKIDYTTPANVKFNNASIDELNNSQLMTSDQKRA